MNREAQRHHSRQKQQQLMCARARRGGAGTREQMCSSIRLFIASCLLQSKRSAMNRSRRSSYRACRAGARSTQARVERPQQAAQDAQGSRRAYAPYDVATEFGHVTARVSLSRTGTRCLFARCGALDVSRARRSPRKCYNIVQVPRHTGHKSSVMTRGTAAASRVWTRRCAGRELLSCGSNYKRVAYLS